MFIVARAAVLVALVEGAIYLTSWFGPVLPR
jgi:hypothetical protein